MLRTHSRSSGRAPRCRQHLFLKSRARARILKCVASAGRNYSQPNLCHLLVDFMRLINQLCVQVGGAKSAERAGPPRGGKRESRGRGSARGGRGRPTKQHTPEEEDRAAGGEDEASSGDELASRSHRAGHAARTHSTSRQGWRRRGRRELVGRGGSRDTRSEAAAHRQAAARRDGGGRSSVAPEHTLLTAVPAQEQADDKQAATDIIAHRLNEELVRILRVIGACDARRTRARATRTRWLRSRHTCAHSTHLIDPCAAERLCARYGLRGAAAAAQAERDVRGGLAGRPAPLLGRKGPSRIACRGPHALAAGWIHHQVVRAGAQVRCRVPGRPQARRGLPGSPPSVSSLPLKPPQGHRDHVLAVAISSDDTVLASAGREKSIFIWDAVAHVLLRTYNVRFHTAAAGLKNGRAIGTL